MNDACTGRIATAAAVSVDMVSTDRSLGGGVEIPP
jgi:hypothetical protein